MALEGIIVQFAIAAYRSGGRDAVVRMLTIPERDVKKITDKTGANFSEAKAARDAWAEAGADFIEN